MCIAVLVKPGAARPGLDDLQKMERANGDGGGVGWYDPSLRRCRWVKGLKAAEVEQAMARVPRESYMLLHFRMASVGGNGAGLTHPFPIGMPPQNDAGEYLWDWDLALEGVADELLIHNGHDPSILKRMPLAGMPAGPWSDTRFVAYMADNNPEFISNLSGKVALINSAGRGMVLGNGWTERSGVFLSNTYWEYPHYTYSGSGTAGHGRYGYYDSTSKRWIAPSDKEYSQEAEAYWDAWVEMDKNASRGKAQNPSIPEASGDTKALTATTGFGAARGTPSQRADSFAAERTKRERKAEEARKRQQAHKERQAASKARKEQYTAGEGAPRDLTALLRCSDYTAGFTMEVKPGEDSAKKGFPRVTCRNIKDGQEGPWRIRFEDGLGGFIEITEDERALQLFWMAASIDSWVAAMNALFAAPASPSDLSVTQLNPDDPPPEETKTATEEWAEVQKALQSMEARGN